MYQDFRFCSRPPLRARDIAAGCGVDRTVSEAMREDLIAHGWDAGKIFAVWNGVDPERYKPGAVAES